MTEQEQNDYVAAKMGIIFLCENCCKRIHSVMDKVGSVIGWIHTETEAVVCGSPNSSKHAEPASPETLIEIFEPRAERLKNKVNAQGLSDKWKIAFDKWSKGQSDWSDYLDHFDRWK